MLTEEILSQKLELIHKEAVDTVITHIKRIKALINEKDEDAEGYDEIRLTTPILYQFIDDQTNELVSSVSMDEENVTIDTGHRDYTMLLNQLSTNVLIAIVGELEFFETFEDVEFQII